MPRETLLSPGSDIPHGLPLTASDRADLVLLERVLPGEIEELIADGGDDRVDTLYLETPRADVYGLVTNGRNLARVRPAATSPDLEHLQQSATL